MNGKRDATVRRPRVLVLGTGSKRSTRSVNSPGDVVEGATAPYSPKIQEDMVALIDGKPGSLYELSQEAIKSRLASNLPLGLYKLPKRILADIIPSAISQASAAVLVRLELCYPSITRWTEARWQELSRSRELVKDSEETWRQFYHRVEDYNEVRVREVSSKVRDTYKAGEDKVRTLQVINRPTEGGTRKRTMGYTDPLPGIRSSSSLMKRTKNEVVQSRKPSNRGGAPQGRLIPPKR